MSERAQYQLAKGKAYAFDVRAFDFLFMMREAARDNQEIGAACVIDIDGPLDNRDSGCWDSYESIKARFEHACASDARGIVLRVSSPGGDAAGCVELSRYMRARAALAGKDLYAWVDERACSAGYILAAAASRIYLSESAIVGSIGVIVERPDWTRANAERGVQYAFITSGKRKTDGCPDVPLTADELAATQSMIDSFAASLFALVRDFQGFDPEPLEAGVFHGAEAVSKRLATALLPFDALIAAINGTGAFPMTEEESAREALGKMASGEGEGAARARKALEALDAAEAEDMPEDEPEGEDGGDEPEDKPEDKPAEESQDHGEPDGDEPPAATAALSVDAIRALVREEMRAEAKANDERGRLLASRPDLDAGTLKTLRDPKTPLAVVRQLVKSIPKPARSKAGAREALAATRATPTAGQTQPELDGPHLPPAERATMNEVMGLTTIKTGVINTPHKQTLGGRI